MGILGEDMRYIIQIMAMLCDIMIIGACAIVIYNLPNMGIIGVVICLYLLGQTYNTFKEQGGFMAWNPYWIKRFMKNSKEIGL
jgi:hypothetical protein